MSPFVASGHSCSRNTALDVMFFSSGYRSCASTVQGAKTRCIPM